VKVPKLPPTRRATFERVDRVCKTMNDWLLVLAFGLILIDALFAIARLAPPTPMRLYDTTTEKTQQSGQPAPSHQGVP
jgi:hypothetical protein